MQGFFQILVYVAMAAVTLILAAGIYSLFRGGDFSRSWSNKLMRARVLVQFLVIVFLLIAVWLHRMSQGSA